MQKVNIAYLSTFYPFRGGIAQFNACLYRAFEKGGHSIKAFTFTTQYPGILFPGKSQMVGSDDKVDAIPARRILSTVNPVTWFSTPEKILQSEPGILLMKFWMPYFAPSLGTVALMTRKKTKTVAILDNVIPHEKRPGDILLTKFFLNQCHGLIVMSETVKNGLLSLKPGAKFLFHPHPMYNHFGIKKNKKEAQNTLGIPDGKKVILFFGFIRKYKGLDLLLQAMAQLPDEYLLVIAGEVYGSFDEYEAIIRKFNLKKNINLNVRYISDAEVSVFFSAADVCVLPYRSATQSGITAIAYHFEVPVIATRTGGLDEMVENGRTGIIIEKPQPEMISASIHRFFNESEPEIMVRNIRSLKEKLSWGHLAESIAGFAQTL